MAKKANHGKYRQILQVNAKVSPEALQGLKELAASFDMSLNAFLNELGQGSFEVQQLSGEF
jgi:hypothetical protein